MMPILAKTDDIRSGRKAKVHQGWLWVAQESMGSCTDYILEEN